MRRTSTRIALAVLVTGTAALGLAACGGQSEYCKLITDNQSLIEGLSTSTDSLNADTVTTLRSIEAVAPDDVKSDWKTFNDYLQAAVDGDSDALQANQDAVTTAGENIDKSFESDCHLQVVNS